MILSREKILAQKSFGIKEIEVPELGGNVYIRKWSGKDRAKFLQASISVDGGNVDVKYEKIFDNMSLVVALSLCDETGVRMFNDDEIELISELNSDAIQSIYQQALELNSLIQKSIGEAAKNLSAIQKNDSTSDLPENSGTQSGSSLTE
jgi:hypothetical protein